MCDDWRPTASLENIRLRARLLTQVRTFFAERDVLEVETPLLSSATVSDPHLQSFVTHYSGPGLPSEKRLYLQTSPEAAMKRLLAAGSGSIYQICKAFRDGERGTRHNPEFTMLEWYRVGFDHVALMDEVEALVQLLLPELLRDQRPFVRISYGELFQKFLDLDPHHVSVEALVACASAENLTVGGEPDGINRDGWLDLLMSHLIEPRLGFDAPCFVYDYPASQAALAKTQQSDEGRIAERFELYVTGMELANGYHELCDEQELLERFKHDCDVRSATGIESPELNVHLFDAMKAGFPGAAGVALGFDRLLMLRTAADSIDKVVTFPVARA